MCALQLLAWAFFKQSVGYRPACVDITAAVKSDGGTPWLLDTKGRISMDPAKVERCLVERDGFCRDMNFADPSWAGVDRLMQWAAAPYDIKEATDSNGTDVIEKLVDRRSLETIFPAPDGYVHVLGDGRNTLIRQLQLFVAREEGGSPFVGMPFFPEGLNKRVFTVNEFVQLMQMTQDLLEASEYFVRYENAGWGFGDCGEWCGVIFSSTDK